MGVVKVDFKDVVMHPALVINFRNQGNMRIADLHLSGPSVRSTETFAVTLDKDGRVFLSKTYTRMSLLDFLRAYQIPFMII